jgi:hypothetical protein
LDAFGRPTSGFAFVAGYFGKAQACSMKNRATGLSVRFFRPTIPTGTLAIDSQTGKTLSSGRLKQEDFEHGDEVSLRAQYPEGSATSLQRTL